MGKWSENQKMIWLILFIMEMKWGKQRTVENICLKSVIRMEHGVGWFAERFVEKMAKDEQKQAMEKNKLVRYAFSYV